MFYFDDGINIQNETLISCKLSSNIFDTTKMKHGDEIRYIGNNLFSERTDELLDIWKGCNELYGAYIGNNVEAIGCNAFRDCDNLICVVIDSPYFYKIDDHAFEGCYHLEKIIFKQTHRFKPLEIGASAFSLTGLNELNLPTKVDSIGKYAFHVTNLTSVTIPETRSLGADAFSGNEKLTKVRFNYDVESIPERCFMHSPITDVSFKFPSALIEVNNLAFFETNLYSMFDVSFDSLKKIGHHAFSNCDFLTRVFLPEGIQEVSDYAFCVNMQYPLDEKHFAPNHSNALTIEAPANSYGHEYAVRNGIRFEPWNESDYWNNL